MKSVFLPSRRETTLSIDDDLCIYTNYESVTPGLEVVFSVEDLDGITDQGDCFEVALSVNVSQVVLRESRLETTYLMVPMKEIKPTSITKESIRFNESVTPGKYLLYMGNYSPKLVTITDTIDDVPYDEKLSEAISQSFMDKLLYLQEVKCPFNQVAQFELKKRENTFRITSDLITRLRITDGQELQTFVLHIKSKTSARVKVMYDVIPSLSSV